MKDKNLDLWQRLKKLPGGDQNPFDTPMGPREDCLTVRQVFDFFESGEKDPKILQHLTVCPSCNKWVTNQRLKNKSGN